MQQILDMIGGPAALGPIAQQVGLSPQQTQAAMAALLPALAGGVKKQAQANPQALQQVASGAHGMTDQPHAVASPHGVAQGNAILGQLFGSKDVSRTVAQHASAQTGIGPDKLKALLPILATLAMGAMAKQGGGAAGGLGGMLGGMLGGGAMGGASMGGGAAPAQRGAGGLFGMLDLDGDGNPLDDIMGMAGKLGR